MIDRRHSGARIRLSMAAHKPVEWVQAIINRFDEQVKKTLVAGFDISRPKSERANDEMLGAFACIRVVCVEDVRLVVLGLHWPNTIRKCLDSGLMCCIWPAKAKYWVV